MLTQFSDIIPTEHQPAGDALIECIKKSKTILITSHQRPDGDAIGSVSGLAKSLLKMKKEVQTALVDGVPERFAFVFPNCELIQSTEINSNHDLIVVLDAGDDARTGINFIRNQNTTLLINVDHHASNNFYGDLNYVDAAASSTCEIVAGLIQRGNMPLDTDIALSLMLGLITDSRSFQNENLRYTAHLAAAMLLATGVDTAPILNSLNAGRSEADLRIQGFGLCNFKLECNGALATLVIKKQDLKKYKAKIANVFGSGIFNILTSMKNTLASVVIFEREDGMSFCEFRSRGGIDVKKVAVSMGGGGHVPAAGCCCNAPVDTVAAEAIEKMKIQVNLYLKANSA